MDIHWVTKRTCPVILCVNLRSLYGLTQLPRTWFDRFARVMTAMGYEQSQYHTLFIKHSSSRKVTTFLVYVYDIIVTKDGDGRDKD